MRIGAGAWIGVKGYLVSLPDVKGGEPVKDERPVSTMTTLGGRVIAQLGASSRRSWSVSLPNFGGDALVRLQALRDAVPMPWVWYSVWATRSNVLTPAQARFEQAWSSGATVGSLVDLEGGGVAVSLLEASLTNRIFASRVPVVAGVPITGSVHARPAAGGGSSVLRAIFYDATDTQISFYDGVPRTLAGFGALGRLSVTQTPPAGAVSCSLEARNISVLAGPALTLTKAVTPWAPGAGCATAVVAGLDMDPDIIGEDGFRRAGISFTVTEVG